MAAKETFDLTCPACRAALTVDPEIKAVLQHKPAPRTGPAASLDKAMEALKGEQARRDAAFRQASEAEKNKGQVLSRKFEPVSSGPRTTPSRPGRDPSISTETDLLGRLLPGVSRSFALSLRNLRARSAPRSA